MNTECSENMVTFASYKCFSLDNVGQSGVEETTPMKSGMS